ncbi:MAG TPA: hypothetical protein DCS55_22350 [Acidimicrobiaceae bacterium]|nr:hypothetical protein [Acidimicrobiaceae bacterium]
MSKAKPSMRACANSERATSPRNALSPHWVSRGAASSTAADRRFTTRLPKARSPVARDTAESTWRRLPMTTSHPASTASSARRSWGGSYARSASVNSATRPRDASIPARTAAPLPRFCGCTMTCSAPASRAMAAVSSPEPSSTTTTSRPPSAATSASSSWMRRTVVPMRSGSRYAGITTVSRHVPSSRGRSEGVWSSRIASPSTQR